MDGDTISCLQAGNKQQKIRLYGIDAPEKKQPFGQQARNVLAKMIAGQIVEIEDTGADRYGRIVGIVKFNGRSVNQAMIENGYAWIYPAFCKRWECAAWKAGETRARNARRGLWRDINPLPPWQWRKQKKKPLQMKRPF